MNPKFEIFKLQLQTRNGDKKTFRDFAEYGLGTETTPNNKEAFDHIFSEYMKAFTAPYAIDKKTKKQLKIVESTEHNEFFKLKPSKSSTGSIIAGVINGGAYGTKRILSDIVKTDEDQKVSMNKSVLGYVYTFLYIPPEHDTGICIITSNSLESSVTKLYRDFLSTFFSGNGVTFSKPLVSPFVPKEIQKDFKETATVAKLVFSDSFIESNGFEGDILEGSKQYNIEVTFSPVGDSKPTLEEASSLFNKIKNKFISKIRGKELKLIDFRNKKLVANSKKFKGEKTFEWNSREDEFIPVIHLKNYYPSALDKEEYPIFEEVKKCCLELFNEKILPEIRPDLNASRYN